MKPLPSSPQFIDTLLSQLSACTKPTPGHRHAHLTPLLLTLHCIFPNELLLALDILDRRLVRCLRREDHREGTSPRPRPRPSQRQGDLFYVISASAPPVQSAESEDALSRKGYEVRLRAWNCTCPSFVLAAFRGGMMSVSSDDHDDNDEEGEGEGGSGPYGFGGSLTRGADRRAPPVCKHLLACLLAVRCPEFTAVGDEGCVVGVSSAVLAGVGAGFGG